MGILNLCADSFSGDGILTLDRAIERAHELALQGAEIVDVGAESAATNRPPMSEDQEAARLGEFIEAWMKSKDAPGVPRPLLSINTWRPRVARAALAKGGHILNDMSALPTDENARICAETGAALLIMHSVGEPKVPHTHVTYDDVLAELERFFDAKMTVAQAAGVSRDAIILDPGIDFAKQRHDSLRILRHLQRLSTFERPLLLAASRKTVIGEVLGIAAPAERDAGTVACIVQGMLHGAAIIRAHNVPAAVQTVKIIQGLETATRLEQ